MEFSVNRKKSSVVKLFTAEDFYFCISQNHNAIHKYRADKSNRNYLGS